MPLMSLSDVLSHSPCHFATNTYEVLEQTWAAADQLQRPTTHHHVSSPMSNPPKCMPTVCTSQRGQVSRQQISNPDCFSSGVTVAARRTLQATGRRHSFGLIAYSLLACSALASIAMRSALAVAWLLARSAVSLSSRW